jgi:predicted PurR-regulated permease PerM
VFILENSTKVILKVVLTVLGLVFLWLIRDIILLLLLSLIVASALEPMVEYFNRHRVPKAVSVLTVYILALGMLALVLYLLIPPAILQFQLLAEKWPEYFSRFQDQLGNVNLSNFSITSLLDEVKGGFLDKTFGVFSGLFSFITVLVVSFYLVAEEQSMKQFVANLLPPQHHEVVLGLIEKIQVKMGKWVLGQIILSFSIFALTYVGLLILGVDYALFLALLAGLLEVVPYIGPFLSAVPAVFFAFIQNPALAIAVVILYIIVQKTEGYVLVPKIMQKTVGLSPLVVLVSLLIGFKLAGILGLLISVPIASALLVVIQEFSPVKNSL